MNGGRTGEQGEMTWKPDRLASNTWRLAQPVYVVLDYWASYKELFMLLFCWWFCYCCCCGTVLPVVFFFLFKRVFNLLITDVCWNCCISLRATSRWQVDTHMLLPQIKYVLIPHHAMPKMLNTNIFMKYLMEYWNNKHEQISPCYLFQYFIPKLLYNIIWPHCEGQF